MKFMLCVLAAFCLTSTVMCNLDLNKEKLKQITGEHLYAEEYEFDSMDIQSIHENTFTDIRKTVIILDLSYNKLTSLPPKVFYGLEKVTELNLGSNKLVKIDPALFKGLKTLLDLKLKNCQLKEVAYGTFNGLQNLHSLDLSMNYIVKLEKNLFNDLGKLEELELQYNKISNLPSDIFSKNKKLEELTLNHNQLQVVDVNKLNNMCLKRFTMDNNKKEYKVIQSKKCMIVSGVKGSTTSDDTFKNAATLTMTNVPSLLITTLVAFIFKKQL